MTREQKTNVYAEAIDHLTKRSKWRDVVIEIAKSSPGTLVKACKKVDLPVDKNNEVISSVEIAKYTNRRAFILAVRFYDEYLEDNANGSKKIRLIKKIRQNFGLGLKEAKDIADSADDTVGSYLRALAQTCSSFYC